MKSLFRSFKNAFNGVLWCLKNERNLRIHFSLCIYMYTYLLVYDFFEVTRTDWAVILVFNALVFCLEIFNTSLEKAVDLATQEYHILAKISKDAAAAAVLVSAIFSVVVGFIILLQPEAFKEMFQYYKENIHMVFVLIGSLVLTFIFILKGFPCFKKKK